MTLFVLVGGLLLAWGQARDLKRSIDMSNWNSVAGQWLDMDKVFIEHPNLRPFIYGRVELPTSDDERDKVLAAATYVLDFIDNALIVGHNIKNPNVTHIEDQETYFDSLILSKSPAICEVFQKAPDGYSGYTKKMIVTHCADGKLIK